jgi:hypothetical protein
MQELGFHLQKSTQKPEVLKVPENHDTPPEVPLITGSE